MSKPKRTRTGCLCCRRRHKKCDEVKPNCTFCRSKGIECEWPVKGAIFVNYNTGSNPLESSFQISPPTPTCVSLTSTNMFTISDDSRSSIPSKPPSLAKSTTSESSMSPRSPQTTLAFPYVLEPPLKRQRTPSFSYLQPTLSPTSSEYSYTATSLNTDAITSISKAEHNHNHNNDSISLPPIKPYHYAPRTTPPPQMVITKRLSVDSLLN